ncbi:MAG: hypothetical protein KY395_04325 [Actinobacteria bacterium]|nr:hypothetical protein [Actinomycetota bacterium]
MTSETTISIPSRFRGPPFSANGGYACGSTAQPLGAVAAEATLNLPPPLDRPLTLKYDADQSTLFDGDSVVAVARPVDPPDEGPVVSLQEAKEAGSALDLDHYSANHAYPGCFTCGPGRDADGLRLFPAPTSAPGVFATVWSSGENTSDGTGSVDYPVVWAALDCPSGLSWLSSDADLGPVVLGRMAAVIRRRPPVGETVVVAGWTKEASGRKRTAGSSLRTPDGELLAAAHATWIVLTDEQRAAFQAASRGA